MAEHEMPNLDIGLTWLQWDPHNANFVINTDADQIIVAHAGTHPVGQLPLIGYRSGNLGDPAIRKAGCDILEGGEHAFREPARRLCVRLKR